MVTRCYLVSDRFEPKPAESVGREGLAELRIDQKAG